MSLRDSSSDEEIILFKNCFGGGNFDNDEADINIEPILPSLNSGVGVDVGFRKQPYIATSTDAIEGGPLLTILEWADDVYFDERLHQQMLVVDTIELPHQMAHSNATGKPLLSNGHLGVDLIRLEAGDGFQPHTHPGHHLLIVVAGEGTITYAGRIYPTRAGQIYMVEGSVPHAVSAITEHVILAVGSPHKAIDSTERMTPVPFEEVTVGELGELHCLFCNRKTVDVDKGCQVSPCYGKVNKGH